MLPLEEYALIGDCETAAQVGLSSSVRVSVTIYA
jgi:hypothetical protein